jgi:hypothetical protein
MAPLMFGTALVSMLAICPCASSVMRSIGSLLCGETISRPCGSTAIATHEPSPGAALRSNSILNPSSTVISSTGVATRSAEMAVAVTHKSKSKVRKLVIGFATFVREYCSPNYFAVREAGKKFSRRTLADGS